jgi:hypothetical protein
MSRAKHRRATELGELLNGESPALTYDEIATKFGLKAWEIESFVCYSRRKLDEDHTPTMLVTDLYFTLGGEPDSRAAAEMCCALHGRRSAGIRRLFIRRNDTLGRTWLRLNQRTAGGKQTCNLDRVAVEHSLKNLSLKRAEVLVGIMRDVMLPYHEKEYGQLMKKITEQLGNGS